MFDIQKWYNALVVVVQGTTYITNLKTNNAFIIINKCLLQREMECRLASVCTGNTFTGTGLNYFTADSHLLI